MKIKPGTVRAGSILAKTMKSPSLVATFNGIETWAYKGKLFNIKRTK